MSDSKDQTPKVSFDEDDGRAFVTAYAQKPKFRVGDKVYLTDSGGSREGPYLVASVPSADKCTLCLENGEAVKDGVAMDMNCVQAA